MDLITYALAKKMGGGGESITYTLTADTENKTIVLTPSEGTAQVITVPYATDASTVNGHEVPELENGKIPANFLPSFVDNVDEYDTISLFPVVGESNRIYIDKSTNKTYRWSGTAYVEISESIALGETSSTAYRGDRGKIAYDHSQSVHAPSNAEANQNAFSNVKIDSDTINASTATDTLEFIAGDNIILTPNVSNKKITVSQAPVRKSASGDIASFDDGAGYPFLKVKANINPVQDLHGYDYPWVGGAGKNKINAPDITLADAGDIYNGAINLVAGTYTLSSSNTTTSVTVEGVSGTMPLTFTLANAITTIQITASGAGKFKNIQIESGSSATSYTPYSNICPISGFTGLNVSVTGVNIWDEEWEVGAYDNTTGVKTVNANVIRSANKIPILPNTTYCFLRPVGQGAIYILYYDMNGNYIRNDYAEESVAYKVFTSASNVYYITFYLGRSYGTTYNNDISINYPSTDTSYHAYNGHVYPISWQDEAGIVYGGYIDLVSGVLTVTKAGIAEYNGETLPLAWISDRDRYVAGNTPTIGAQVVYTLATPQTYQLTPQQINTLIGQNNVWNDVNGQTEVEYKAPFYNDLTTKNEVQALINESITSALNASY